MDPILTPLILQVALEGLKLANKILETQPPDVAADMWRRHNKDIDWWRRLVGIDKDDGKSN